MQVNGDVYAWLAEHGLVKSKAGGKAGTAGTLQSLPAHLAAQLLSGEAFVKLLNGIFAKHGLKQSVQAPPGSDRYQTWQHVSKGLHRLAVELDDETVTELAGGDSDLVAELLGEVYQVYRHWAVAEAKRQKRRNSDRRTQPQQGSGYGQAARAGRGYGGNAQQGAQQTAAADRGEKAKVSEGRSSGKPASTASPPQSKKAKADTSSAVAGLSHAAAKEAAPASPSKSTSATSPRSARHPASSSQPSPGRHGAAGPSALESEGAVDSARTAAASSAVESNEAVGADVRLDEPERNAHEAPTQLSPHVPMHAPEKFVNIEVLLANLSSETELEAATSAPELLGLSMMRNL